MCSVCGGGGIVCVFARAKEQCVENVVQLVMHAQSDTHSSQNVIV